MTTTRKRRQEPRSGLDLVEEAVHLLRQSPAALAAHCVGMLPFAMAFLYFWSDMSRGAFADRRCAAEALALAALFLWMKTWQTIFSRFLFARLSGEAPPRWTWPQLARVIMIHATWQPTAFLLMPIAAILTVPFVWTYAFYQNLAVVAGEEAATIRGAARKAWQLAWLWTGQNHFALAATWLFGCFVFFNVLLALWMAPLLCKMLLGIESNFTRAGAWMFSSTTFAVAGVLTWIGISLITRTVQVLRCFYGESVRTGQDLLAELRSLAASAVVFLSLFFLAAPARAETTPPPSAVSATELDRSIERVLQQSRYTWRFPRERTPKPEEHGWLTQLAQDISDSVKGWLRALFRQARNVARWVIERFGRKPPDWAMDTDRGWADSVRGLLMGLIAIVAGLLGALLWREWRRRRPRTDARLTADEATAAPDVADENVMANQLPEEDWLARARDFCEAGELRLALRAMYLAMLAHLGRRELITIARHKSNCEYERELARRARSQTELLAAFAGNREAFEDAWYGLHEVSAQHVEQFQFNLERIRRDVATR